MKHEQMQNPWTRLKSTLAGNHGTHRGFVRYLFGEIAFLAGRLDDHATPDLARCHRLVFVCLGNINRSAFAHRVAEDAGLKVASLGLSTSTGAPAFPVAVETARRFDTDLTQHTATDLRDYTYLDGDLLMVMEIRHCKRLVEAGIPADAIAYLGQWATPRRIHIHDPHTLSEAYFRTCFTIIQSAVRELAIQARETNSPCVLR